MTTMTDATGADLVKVAAQSLRISERLNRQITEEGAQRHEFSYANTLLCLCAEVLGAFYSLVVSRTLCATRETMWTLCGAFSEVGGC